MKFKQEAKLRKKQENKLSNKQNQGESKINQETNLSRK